MGALVLWGFGQALLAPALSAYAVDVSPVDKLGQALSLHRQAGDLTMLIAPVSLGLLADSLSSHGYAILAYSVLCQVCALAFAARSRPDSPN